MTTQTNAEHFRAMNIRLSQQRIAKRDLQRRLDARLSPKERCPACNSDDVWSSHRDHEERRCGHCDNEWRELEL
jgi:hypothetical protein